MLGSLLSDVILYSLKVSNLISTEGVLYIIIVVVVDIIFTVFSIGCSDVKVVIIALSYKPPGYGFESISCLCL